MIETVTLQQLEAVVQQLQSVKNIECDDDSVTFKYRDKDGDEVTSVITLVNEERASAMLLLEIPESHIVSAMIVSNLYNSRKDVHGTFAYATNVGDDKFFIVLESHISTRGGVSETNIRQQLRTFLDQINGFESVMIEGINKLGPDVSFLKGSGAAGFWEAVGAFAGGFWQGYQGARS
jgi:hypothetical protein